MTASLLKIGLRLAVAAIMATAAIGKFSADPAVSDVFQRLEMGTTGRLLIGALEAAVALGLVLPSLAPSAAVLGWGVMTGALIAHATRLGISGDAAMLAALATANWLGCLALSILDRDRVPLLGDAFSPPRRDDP